MTPEQCDQLRRAYLQRDDVAFEAAMDELRGKSACATRQHYTFLLYDGNWCYAAPGALDHIEVSMEWDVAYDLATRILNEVCGRDDLARTLFEFTLVGTLTPKGEPS